MTLATSSTRQLLDALKAALASRNRAAANCVIADLVRLDAPLNMQWRSLATLAFHHGEIGLAVAAMDRLVAASRGDPRVRQERAGLLARVGRLDEAREALEALTAGVDPVSRDYSLATIALDGGDLGKARELLRSVVATRPQSGSAWLALAVAGGSGEELLSAAPAMAAAPHPEQAAYCYAVGKIRADRGEHDEAFAALSRGATMRRASMRHDRAEDAKSAAMAMEGAEAIRVVAPSSARSRTIIVTGLPRSGTTLVEQILASHSQIAGSGELNLLRLLALDAGGTSAAAAKRYEAEGGSMQALRGLYDHLTGERFGPVGRIVDKSLNMSRFLGLAVAAMPDVPIVWLRRDPLDCAWSCFRTHFTSGVEWSLDLTDVAHHFRLEDRLWKEWSNIMGARILTVPYEQLVGAPEVWTRRLLEHCGLSEEAAVYQPHLTRRPVTTSSVTQVRRPISRDAIGAAEPYRRHLQPFLDGYLSS